MKRNIDFRLSIDNTLTIKGLAICLMLWHHLFYMNPEYGSFVFQMAQFGKVCVSLFLFASAYGLTIQYGKIINEPIAETFKFQAKRFVKFYANYWVVFLIFVPIGVFVFGQGLDNSYGDENFVKMLVKDILGINSRQSYNITWWFNQLIICLYLLFPILFFVMHKQRSLFGWFLCLVGWFFLWILDIKVIPNETIYWAFHFSLGIVFAQNAKKMNQFFNRFNYFFLVFLFLLSFIFLCVFRNCKIVPIFNGTTVDAFLAVNIVFLVVLIGSNNRHYLLSFLGKHSINIYMIHTFIYYYWFKYFIYSFEYPILIFVVLLAICLVISILLEQLKKKVKLDRLIKNVSQKIE